MNAEFDWWLLLVGLAGGAGLTWLILADFSRRDDEIASDERALEADRIALALGRSGRRIDPATVEEVLDLHRAYLAGPAPDLDPEEPTEPAGGAGPAVNSPARDPGGALPPRGQAAGT